VTAARVRRAAARAADDLQPVFRAFGAATGCAAALWDASDAPWRRLVSTARPAAPDDPAAFAEAAGAALRDGTPHPPPDDARGRAAVRVAAVPGAPDTWLVVGPCAEPAGDPEADAARLDAQLGLLLPLVAGRVRAATEVEQAAQELTERYEEINLLYTISEILGRTVTLEETAATILTEVSETVGARRAAIFVHDRVTDTLVAVAALGAEADALPPVRADDPASLPARVFRTLHPVIDESPGPPPAAEAPVRDGTTLAVPILWTAPGGGEPLGVVVLSGRGRGQQFTAGDLKLVSAIASQIAAAIQNARLVRASLQQQRLAQEMVLAHDLQMALLPRADAVAPDARVAARVVPAESVGGDFYHLFRLPGGRTGVMIGDVSGHGYRAAMIMALAMSAAAIHAQESDDPARTLAAVLGSVGDELGSTEMFISTFYGVVDPARGELRYANAGHPHAFVVGPDGVAERLPAGAPPLGMVPDPPAAAVRAWRPGADLLLLFTDGVSDARDRAGQALGERAVLDAVAAARGAELDEVVRRTFAMLDAHRDGAPLRDDLTLLVLRS
jgi:sigma-B regulation protein RsbU (phosphoserine phosphatase)